MPTSTSGPMGPGWFMLFHHKGGRGVSSTFHRQAVQKKLDELVHDNDDDEEVIVLAVALLVSAREI